MPLAPVIKNGKTYDAGDVTVSLLGYLENDVVQLSYTTAYDHTANYALARKMNSYSMGKEKPSGKITFFQTAVRKLEKICAQANGGDTNLSLLKPFTITVDIVNDDQEEIIDHITCKFQSQGREITGTDGLQMEFDLFVLDIEFGAA